ncbi:cell adhesion molecule 4-like [Antedon mediterranea]|uniref:cell adhesion molecule 4-like n=1 Tax=Antedon mediterranea TaxID=105859 RepID=UPI003AF850A5
MEVLKCVSVIAIIVYIVESVEFAERPKDVGEIEGKAVTLKCYIDDLRDDSYTVSWWKNNVKISSQAEVKVTDSRFSVNLEKVVDTHIYSYMLLIANLKQTDEGEYHCEINNGIKMISSQPAHLAVYQIPSSEYPKCIQSKESYVVGSAIKLSCISEMINPPVQLIWSYKTRDVSLSKTSAEIKDSLVYNHYVFEANKLDNDGTFTCFQTTDVLPEKRNCTIQNLNIQYRPEVKIQHTSTLFAGSDSILFCQSFANPPVTQFRWAFSPVLHANEYIADGQVLTLTKPSITKNGTIITCSAENNVGISRDSITLIISNVRKNEDSTEGSNDVMQLHKVNTNKNNEENKDSVSLYVVIIIIILVVIIVVVVVIIPVYYQCFCKTRTATDSSGRELYQPTVYYDTRDRVSNSGRYDRSLPRLPSTGHYGHWRHSFASQVPEDLDVQGYTYIEDRNNQNTL